MKSNYNFIYKTEQDTKIATAPNCFQGSAMKTFVCMCVVKEGCLFCRVFVLFCFSIPS